MLFTILNTTKNGTVEIKARYVCSQVQEQPCFSPPPRALTSAFKTVLSEKLAPRVSTGCSTLVFFGGLQISVIFNYK